MATDNENYLATAVQTADALIISRKIKDGSFVQFKPDAEFRYQERIHTVQESDTTYLRPHAYLGLALTVYKAIW